MSSHTHRETNPEELEKQWAGHRVQIPRMPFGLINVYQFCVPILVLMGIDLLVWKLFQIFALSMIVQILFLPGLFILNYFLYIWLMSKACRLLNIYYEHKSPSTEGVYAREFKDGNIADIALQYYHLRGFMYKWPVWMAKKSIFPWLVNFVLCDMTMGGNDIDKDALYGDAFVSLEFTTLDAGAVIMDGVCISSHVVDSIFGNLTMKRVTVQKNGVMHANSIMAPGGVITQGMAIGPRAFATKHFVVKSEDSQFVWRTPPRKWAYRSFLDLLPESFQTQWKTKQQEFSEK